MAATSDLEAAFKALKGKQSRYSALYDYYNGRAPIVYATERLRTTFLDLTARWAENWCSVVVDSLLERLQLDGFKLEDEAAKSVLDELWDSLDLSLDADDIARDVAVCSEAFLIVEQVDGAIRAFANAPHLCHAHYSEDNPREMDWAAKWFERDGQTHLTLYYPDRLEHYVAAQKRCEISEYTSFHPDAEFEGGTEPNEYERIPLFHFQRDRNSPYGELQNVIPLQNALNKLFADMMVSAEYGAYPQRYAILQAGTQSSDLKAAPNTFLTIPYDAESGGQRPEVGQFAATQLKNFLDGIDHIAGKIAVISRTPKHYLLQGSGDPSGEALIAMEAPLTRKAGKYTQRLGVTWCQAAQFMLALAGHTVSENELEPIWEDVRTVQPFTESEIHLNNAKAGIPIEWQLEQEGYSEDEIAALQDVDAQRTARAAQFSEAALEDARRRFNAGQVAGMPGATVAE